MHPKMLPVTLEFNVSIATADLGTDLNGAFSGPAGFAKYALFMHYAYKWKQLKRYILNVEAIAQHHVPTQHSSSISS